MNKIITVCVITLALTSCASVRAKKPFTVDIYSPRYVAGSIEVQIDKVFGGLKKIKANVYYYPDESAVCLEFTAESVFFSQFWSGDGRDAFIAALEQYKTDYEQRNLAAKSARTKRAYGKVQGYLVWGVLRMLSDPARGVVTMDLGYMFKDNMPYFSLTQRPAEYKDNTSRKTQSPNVMLYFTRAQAEELAALFNQEYLDGLEQSGETPSEGVKDILRDMLNFR